MLLAISTSPKTPQQTSGLRTQGETEYQTVVSTGEQRATWKWASKAAWYRYDKGTSEIQLICIQRSDSEQVAIISSNTKESLGKGSIDRKVTAAEEVHPLVYQLSGCQQNNVCVLAPTFRLGGKDLLAFKMTSSFVSMKWIQVFQLKSATNARLLS